MDDSIPNSNSNSIASSIPSSGSERERVGDRGRTNQSKGFPSITKTMMMAAAATASGAAALKSRRRPIATYNYNPQQKKRYTEQACTDLFADGRTTMPTSSQLISMTSYNATQLLEGIKAPFIEAVARLVNTQNDNFLGLTLKGSDASLPKSNKEVNRVDRDRDRDPDLDLRPGVDPDLGADLALDLNWDLLQFKNSVHGSLAQAQDVLDQGSAGLSKLFAKSYRFGDQDANDSFQGVTKEELNRGSGTLHELQSTSQERSTQSAPSDAANEAYSSNPDILKNQSPSKDLYSTSTSSAPNMNFNFKRGIFAGSSPSSLSQGIPSCALHTLHSSNYQKSHLSTSAQTRARNHGMRRRLEHLEQEANKNAANPAIQAEFLRELNKVQPKLVVSRVEARKYAIDEKGFKEYVRALTSMGRLDRTPAIDLVKPLGLSTNSRFPEDISQPQPPVYTNVNANANANATGRGNFAATSPSRSPPPANQHVQQQNQQQDSHHSSGYPKSTFGNFMDFLFKELPTTHRNGQGSSILRTLSGQGSSSGRQSSQSYFTSARSQFPSYQQQQQQQYQQPPPQYPQQQPPHYSPMDPYYYNQQQGAGGQYGQQGESGQYSEDHAIPVKLVESFNWRSFLLTFAQRLVLFALFYNFVLSPLLEKAATGMTGMSWKAIESIRSTDKSFDDVKGIDEAKAELEEIVEYLKNPEKFSRLGGKLSKGVLLTGDPGTGKTLLAKAVAGEAGVPFFYASGSEFEELYVGVGARRVRELFAAAKKEAPCIVFIDEIDAVGSRRSARDQQALKMTLNQLLVELDGFNESSGVIVMGATNFPQTLDSALVRPGRFDRQVAVSLPDIKGRTEILQLYLQRVPTSDDVDVNVVARATPGASGADLANLINSAALRASVQGKDKVDMADLIFAKDKVRMGPERRSAIIPPEVKRYTAHHEGGHAIVALLTPGATPVEKVTVIPRGQALGMLQYLPEEKDMMQKSKREMLAAMDVAMAGHAAEELIFGADNVTSGASNDFQQATRIARDMVIHYGMGSKDVVGKAYVESEGGGASGLSTEDLSGETRRLIDVETSKLLNDSFERAKKLLTQNKAGLKCLAEELLDKETLTADEIRKILKRNK